MEPYSHPTSTYVLAIFQHVFPPPQYARRITPLWMSEARTHGAAGEAVLPLAALQPHTRFDAFNNLDI